MGEIKSAFEIAMERSEDVKSDKSSLEAHEYRTTGKRLASKFLEDPGEKENDLGKQLKSYSGKQKVHVKEGMFETLLNNITLPLDDFDEKRFKTIEQGMHSLLPDKRFVSSIFQQIQQFFQQYVENKKQIKSHLEQQFAQKLQQKQQEVSQRLGTEVELDPEQDPEFSSYLKQHTSQLTAQFQEALDQGKEELRKMFDKSK
jgi:hypothetical protein